MRKTPLAIAFALSFGLASAAEVPAALAAKFVKIVSSGRVLCKDASMAGELVKVGVALDGDSKFAWAISESDVKALKASKKCVITNRIELLAVGGTVAIVEEGGKPQMYIHTGNLEASGATLPDAVLKVSKRQ